ncbi:MAG TPA: transketolase [Candidatus Limnocylindrales bacterium]|nr:transketolase [Candidatus Limnocylindrales bacterium]
MRTTAPRSRSNANRSDADAGELRELAQQLRVDAIRASAAAGAGHPTSAMSAAELMAVLVSRHLRVDPAAADDPARDHLILSKGHASPLLYAALVAIGLVDERELLTFRQPGSRLQGHPVPGVPLVDVATGSLGIGLSVGVGMALAMQRLEPRSSRIWVLCGDGELAEGSVWEAVEAAGAERLDAITAIVDVNRLGQTGTTRHGWDLGAMRRRFEAFDWRVIEIDGHDVRAIDGAFRTASETRFRPTVVLARTIKGRGVRRTADQPGLHGKPLPDADEAIAELGGIRGIRVTPPPPHGARARDRRSAAREPAALPSWPLGSRLATRDAVGEALVALGSARPDLVVLDADVGDSTRLGQFRDADPKRLFQLFIAEQLLVGAAMGFAVRGWTVVAGSFGAFLLRAADIVRMAAVGGIPLRLVGSHAGVSIGSDGPSQMGLEDVAFFRALDGAAVLQPSDANQAARLLEAILDAPGIAYLRVLRGETEVRTPPDESIRIGGSRLLAASPGDRVTIVASGATVEEAARAVALLRADGVAARLVDAYSIKPLDADAIATAIGETEGRLVVAEDHRPEGGLGSAVLEAMADRGVPVTMVHLAVRGMPGSASPEEQRAAAGIDAEAIRRAARRLVRGERGERAASDASGDDAPMQGAARGRGDGL